MQCHDFPIPAAAAALPGGIAFLGLTISIHDERKGFCIFCISILSRSISIDSIAIDNSGIDRDTIDMNIRIYYRDIDTTRTIFSFFHIDIDSMRYIIVSI